MTGRQVFCYFFMFFGIIAAVNAVMATLAIQTHSGLVTDHAYEKGLAYNEVVKAEEAQEKLGWHGKIDYADNALYFNLKDKNGIDIQPDKITATFTRPTKSGMDFTIELKGEQTPVDFPAKGIWHVRVDTLVGENSYQQSKRVVVE